MKQKAARESSPPTALVRILELSGGDTILASRRKGERLCEAIEAAAAVAPLVVLDFQGADTVTPSFFLGGAWPLWERGHVEQFPVVANLPEEAVDDLDLVAKLKRNPIWTGRFSGGRFSKPALRGELEAAEADLAALDRIFRLGTASASELAEEIGLMGVTGWNNRLAALWQKKVLARRRSGRMFVYSAPWRTDHV